MKKTVCVLILAVFLAGCSSMSKISVPFMHARPDYNALNADALRDVAAQIENAVKTGNRDAVIEGKDTIVVSGETVKQAIHTRIARAQLVNEYLESGLVKEQSNSLIAIVKSNEYKKISSKDRDRVALVVMSENGDRWALYEGIVKDSHLKGGARAAVQDIFYKVRTGEK